MVAFAEEYLPAQSPARSQNRAECFFARQTCRAAHGAPAARFNAGENSCCCYDACRGASLAQGDDSNRRILMVEDSEGNVFVPIDTEYNPIFVPEGYDIHANGAEAKERWNPFWFHKKVRGGGDWDYKLLTADGRFEALGNYNYGYTGEAFGFPEETLLRQAGQAQIRSGTSRSEWQIRKNARAPMSPPFGDDPRDQMMIQRGIDARKNDYQFTTIGIQW